MESWWLRIILNLGCTVEVDLNEQVPTSTETHKVFSRIEKITAVLTKIVRGGAILAEVTQTPLHGIASKWAMEIKGASGQSLGLSAQTRLLGTQAP